MQRSTLAEALRAALRGELATSWIYAPPGELEPNTPCLLIELYTEPELDESNKPVEAARLGFTCPIGTPDMIEDIAESARQIQDPPSDDLLLKALNHYFEFDAYLSE